MNKPDCLPACVFLFAHSLAAACSAYMCWQPVKVLRRMRTELAMPGGPTTQCNLPDLERSTLSAQHEVRCDAGRPKHPAEPSVVRILQHQVRQHCPLFGHPENARQSESQCSRTMVSHSLATYAPVSFSVQCPLADMSAAGAQGARGAAADVHRGALRAQRRPAAQRDGRRQRRQRRGRRPAQLRLRAQIIL